MLRDFLTDAEMAEVASNSHYAEWASVCPTCDDDGTYRFEGEEHECKKDDFDRCEQRELGKWYALADVPIEHAKLIWDDFPDGPIKDVVDQYVANWKTVRKAGRGLDLAGKHGLGKTWVASHILGSVIKQGYSGYSILFTKLKGAWERPDRDQILRKVEGSALLVIDDILKPYGEGNMRAFYEEKLEAVLRERAMYNMPTIVTTNLVEEEFDQYYPRVFSVLSGKQVYLEFPNTGDHRKKMRAAWDRVNDLPDMNGEVAPLR